MLPRPNPAAPGRSHGWRRRLVGPLAALLACAAMGCDRVEETYKIGGHVRLPEGTPLEDVRVVVTWPEIPGTAKPLTTDAEGRYSWEWGTTLLGNEGGLDHVRVTPEDPGYTFDPAAYDLVLEGDRLDLDFTATPLEAGRAGPPLVLLIVVSGPGPEPARGELAWHGALGSTPVVVRVVDARRDRARAADVDR